MNYKWAFVFLITLILIAISNRNKVITTNRYINKPKIICGPVGFGKKQLLIFDNIDYRNVDHYFNFKNEAEIKRTSMNYLGNVIKKYIEQSSGKLSSTNVVATSSGGNANFFFAYLIHNVMRFTAECGIAVMYESYRREELHTQTVLFEAFSANMIDQFFDHHPDWWMGFDDMFANAYDNCDSCNCSNITTFNQSNVEFSMKFQEGINIPDDQKILSDIMLNNINENRILSNPNLSEHDKSLIDDLVNFFKDKPDWFKWGIHQIERIFLNYLLTVFVAFIHYQLLTSSEQLDHSESELGSESGEELRSESGDDSDSDPEIHVRPWNLGYNVRIIIREIESREITEYFKQYFRKYKQLFDENQRTFRDGAAMGWLWSNFKDIFPNWYIVQDLNSEDAKCIIRLCCPNN